MIIKSCYIENFGCFSQRQFDFASGLNIMKEDNGWGKSTLAVFIKAMFYGMEYSQARKELSERNKYYPWQGGKYGGNLVFEMNGYQYKIHRFFGKRKNSDEFKLYNLASNKISDDFTENVGEELFGIDADSFERSIFITMDGKYPVMLDSINAKLNNLIDNTEDINNFENAYVSLEKVAKSIVPLRNTGGKKLGEIEQRLAQLNLDIKETEDAETQMYLIEEIINKDKKDYFAINQNITELQKDISNSIKLLKKQEYNRILNKINEKEIEVDLALKKLNHNIPDAEKINKYTEAAREIESLKMQLNRFGDMNERRQDLLKLEEYFLHGYPDEDELEEYKYKIIKYKQLNVEIQEKNLTEEEKNQHELLLNQYRNISLKSEDVDLLLNDYYHVMDLNKDIDKNKSLIQYKEEAGNKKERRRDRLILNLLGIGLILIGILIFFVKSKFTGIVIAMIAIALLLISHYKIRNKIDEEEDELMNLHKEIEEMEKRKDLLEKKYFDIIYKSNFNIDLSNIHGILNQIKTDLIRQDILEKKRIFYLSEINKINEERLLLEKEINNFFSNFPEREIINDDLKMLNIIQNNINKYMSLKNIIDEWNDINQKKNRIEPKLIDYVSKYNNEASQESYIKSMEMIRDHYHHYLSQYKELEILSEEFNKFKIENDVQTFLSISETDQSFGELQDELSVQNEEKERIIKLLAHSKKKWEEQSLIAEKKQDYESEKYGLEKEREVLIEKYNIINQTMKYLKEAKERLSTRYMGGMTKAFNKYMEILTSNDVNVYIDTELNAIINQYGDTYRKEYLSSGYKDIVHLCTRLALIEVMYEKEEPFIILDDPFVNFDDEKLDKAIKLIQELSKNRQIIYFVCQESRNIRY